MRKLMAGLLLSLLCATAFADELADAIKAWEKHDFTQARQLFSKLANAGNPEAQLLLGEMYGYGEGVPEDLALAERWIGQAEAGGNKEAARSLANVRQRQARKADIARYVSRFDGAGLTLAKFGCVAPALPNVSTTQVEIKALDAGIKEWRACYERFGAHLAAQLPAGKAIPPDLAQLMNLVELERARSAMDQAYAAAAERANREAMAIVSANDGWYARTKQYALSMEKQLRDESERRQRELDDTQQRARAAALRK
jgi:TPR repeat protein